MKIFVLVNEFLPGLSSFYCISFQTLMYRQVDGLLNIYSDVGFVYSVVSYLRWNWTMHKQIVVIYFQCPLPNPWHHSAEAFMNWYLTILLESRTFELRMLLLFRNRRFIFVFSARQYCFWRSVWICFWWVVSIHCVGHCEPNVTWSDRGDPTQKLHESRGGKAWYASYWARSFARQKSQTLPICFSIVFIQKYWISIFQ